MVSLLVFLFSHFNNIYILIYIFNNYLFLIPSWIKILKWLNWNNNSAVCLYCLSTGLSYNDIHWKTSCNITTTLNLFNILTLSWWEWHVYSVIKRMFRISCMESICFILGIFLIGSHFSFLHHYIYTI